MRDEDAKFFMGHVEWIAKTLDRIAVALEGIDGRLPAPPKAADREEVWREWRKVRDAVEREVQGSMRRFLGGLELTVGEKAAVAKVRRALFHWAVEGRYGKGVPTPEVAEVLMMRSKVALATFDWSRIDLTPFMRKRFDGLLARRKP